MIKLEDSRENYSYFSGKVSDIVRHFGFAGIALIWIFKVSVDGKTYVPEPLIIPGIIIVAALMLDLLQYLSGTIAWGIFNRKKENEFNKSDLTNEAIAQQFFQAPRYINWATIFFFWLKIPTMIAAYVFIIEYMADTLA